MKTILKNIMLFAAGALTLGFTACEEDGQDLNFKIQPGNELYAPADNASVNLDQGLNTSFEWAPSVAEDGGLISQRRVWGGFQTVLYARSCRAQSRHPSTQRLAR